MDPALGQEVPQQIIVHGEIERDAEAEAFHVRRRLHPLVLDVQRDGLSIDILHGRHVKRCRQRARAQRERQRHGREEVRGIHLLVHRPVPDHGPSGRASDRRVQAMLLIEAQRLRHDDRGAARDGDEPDTDVLLFRLAHRIRRKRRESPQRKHLCDQRRQGRGSHTGQQLTPGRPSSPQDRVDHCLLDRPLKIFLR